MIWVLISIGIGLVLLILDRVLKGEYSGLNQLLMLFIGAFVLFYFSYVIESANNKKILKYNICKNIEKDYGLVGHNYLTEYLPLVKSKVNGIIIFRLIKVLLFLFYVMLIIVTIASMHIKGELYIWIWVPITFVGLGIIGAIVMEYYYWKTKLNIKNILKNNEK